MDDMLRPHGQSWTHTGKGKTEPGTFSFLNTTFELINTLKKFFKIILLILKKITLLFCFCLFSAQARLQFHLPQPLSLVITSGLLLYHLNDRSIILQEAG